MMEQRTEEWFKARLGIPTASAYAAVRAGKDTATRQEYLAKLVVERLTGRKFESYTSPAMQTGIDREPAARAAYESAAEVLVQEVGFFRHDTIPTGGSPDGLVGDSGMIEIKCPSLGTHLKYLELSEGRAPAQYVPQIQGLLWLTDREWCDFISYNPEFPERLHLAIRRIYRDEEYINALRADIITFEAEVTKRAKWLGWTE